MCLSAEDQEDLDVATAIHNQKGLFLEHLRLVSAELLIRMFYVVWNIQFYFGSQFSKVH